MKTYSRKTGNGPSLSGTMCVSRMEPIEERLHLSSPLIPCSGHGATRHGSSSGCPLSGSKSAKAQLHQLLNGKSLSVARKWPIAQRSCVGQSGNPLPVSRKWAVALRFQKVLGWKPTSVYRKWAVDPTFQLGNPLPVSRKWADPLPVSQKWDDQLPVSQKSATNFRFPGNRPTNFRFPGNWPWSLDLFALLACRVPFSGSFTRPS